MKNEVSITPEIIARHGITEDEFERIKKILGRAPNITELGIFSVMWSEHCSYKNSRPELKKLPREAPFILVKAGEENAGIVDIGDGWAIAFKIESHNHPSAVEPFQGAATGVGGIIRDIFTMGARPILNMNSLRFGPIDDASGGVAAKERSGISSDSACAANRSLFAGVVAGVAHYGNCIGIPTVGGEVYFDECYNGNPLVNALSLGILRHDQIKRGKAAGVGNPVTYVGSATGRDGLAGAAFASRELTEESQQDRPGRASGRPIHGETVVGSVFGGHADGGAGGRHSGHGRGRADVFDVRDGEPGRHGQRDRPRSRPETRDGDDAVRDHAERIAGAHVVDRAAGTRERGRGDFQQVGPARRDDWARDG